jgi:hypothetical protein
MKQLANILISATLLSLACTGSALALEIEIDPNGYTGQWTLDYGAPQTGIAVLTLGEPDTTTGAHTLSLGGTEILFDVAADGTIVPRNTDAAAARGGTLRLKTTTIEIDPVHFTGDWRIVEGGTRDLQGKRRVTLVRGLRFYALEIGATGGFHFAIDGEGTVHVENALAATGGPKTLTLNNTERFQQ